MKNKKILFGIGVGVIVALFVAGYIIISARSASPAITGVAGAVIGDQIMISDGTSYRLEDNTKIKLDPNASKITASPTGENFLSFVEPSQQYPTGKFVISPKNGSAEALPNGVAEAAWLDGENIVYTQADGDQITISTYGPAGIKKLFERSCKYINLVVANSENIVANCLDENEVHTAYLVSASKGEAKKLDIPADNVVLSASPRLTYAIVGNPNGTDEPYLAENLKTARAQPLSGDFYPDSVKWITENSFAAISDKSTNSGSDAALGTPQENILVEFSIDSSGRSATKILKAFTQTIVDYNVISGKIILLLSDKTKVELAP